MKRSRIQPKSTWKRPRRHSRLNPIGKKGRAWIDARSELKVEFTTMGITSCELRYKNCAGDDFLGFAHAAKRRKLKPEDLKHVILACNFCHDQIEVLPPEEMKRIVDETIHRRITTAAYSV